MPPSSPPDVTVVRVHFEAAVVEWTFCVHGEPRFNAQPSSSVKTETGQASRQLLAVSQESDWLPNTGRDEQRQYAADRQRDGRRFGNGRDREAR